MKHAYSKCKNYANSLFKYKSIGLPIPTYCIFSNH